MSLDSQVVIILDGIKYFCVWFSDNSQLVLKMRFPLFSFASKKTQEFSSDRKAVILF